MSEVVQFDQFAKLPEQYRRRAREIAKRVADIDALFPACATDDIRDAVVRLRGQLRPQPDTAPTDLAAEFKAACRDLPAWAISEAATDFLAGRVDNHTGQYMPTCAEFAKRAREILVPFLSERAALKVEASKLIERATDDARRHAIAIERQNPAVKARVAALIDAARFGSPKPAALTHQGLSAEQQARLDAMKKQPIHPSKITETKIVKGK